jgi:phytanoyl-CoA hydroxylase
VQHDVPATTPQTLADEDVRRYREQGFIHIRGAITPREAEEYRAAAAAAMERLADKSLTKGRGRVEQIFTQIVNVWREDEPMRRLTLHPNIGGLAERLAGIPLRIWHDHMLVKLPNNQAPTEFHQDRPYWPHASSRHTLSAWIALVDVPVERGCMTFIPGSHARGGLRPQNLTDSEDLFRVAPDLAWEPRVTVPLRAGDCTFHNGLCAHMALANQTDQTRFAHVVIYMDAETTYTGQRHVVTDPLGLAVGQPLDGELFPRATQDT